MALADFLNLNQRSQPVSRHQHSYYDLTHMQAVVSHQAALFTRKPFQHYALYCKDAYPFAVLLFALLHAGKQPWIPTNKLSGTADSLRALGCELLGDWDVAYDSALDAGSTETQKLSPLNPLHSQIILFTSGSTGYAKPVAKTLTQLQAEVDNLERLWGKELGECEVLATVSHQHIYGLIFRILWPIAAGRCFHSQSAINPEILVSQTSANACWIASPAHLKRLDKQSPWSDLNELSAIFSSGGPLPVSAAERISKHCGKAVIEIYGSTETGGIGWRQYPKSSWSVFKGLSLIPEKEAIRLRSPYLLEENGVILEDTLSLHDDGCFMLHGRLDRIVKIEEKRLSLTELEQRLIASGWLDEAFALVLNKNRDTVAVAVTLSLQGQQQALNLGRKAFIRQLQNYLANWFDAVKLPRRWLLLNQLPQTSLGKIDTILLKQLLIGEDGKLPLLLGLNQAENIAELQLKIPGNLIYFPDHFANFPILPGVIQIAWVEHFANLLLGIEPGKFSEIEALKFVKPILPGCELLLVLEWKTNNRKLYFYFHSLEQQFSSGRLVYLGEDMENA